MIKTLDKWITEYENKTGEKHTVPIAGHLRLYYVPDRGYAEISLIDGCVVIYETCGDAQFWHDFGVILCQENNRKYLMTVCIRAIEPYIRFWKWKINFRHYNKDEGYLDRATGTNQYDKSLTIGVAWKRNNAKSEKERYAYYVQSEVN
ncbi:MAG: hypothetical protein PHS04_04185 [Tissierellia bacterium]|nr:hypothetical protein [Tissierellia bacterium]